MTGNHQGPQASASYAVQQALAAERRRNAEIANLAAEYDLIPLGRQLILAGTPIAEARSEMMMAAAAQGVRH